MTAADKEAIKTMYTAILQVSMVSSAYYTEGGALDRVKQIADAALIEINSKHTKLAQEALGIGQ